MKHTSIKVPTYVTNVFGFALCSTEVSQAYLQSVVKVLRDVYLHPTKESHLPPGTLLKLLRPLYGLPDAGDYWHSTFSHHMTKDLGMQQAFRDLALLYNHVKWKLKGLGWTQVDDTLLTGDDAFKRLNKETSGKYESKSTNLDRITFSGTALARTQTTVLLQQTNQADRMPFLQPDANYSSFKSALADMAWLFQARPDVSCAIVQLAQTTERTINLTQIKNLNTATRVVRNNPKRGILHRQLEYASLLPVAYDDGSFSNNDDKSSQLGYLSFLTDRHDVCTILRHRSFNIRRTTRSILSAEVMASAEAFDCAFALQRELDNMFRKRLRHTIYTDSRSLFDVTTRNSSTAERNLTIDVGAARQSYTRL